MTDSPQRDDDPLVFTPLSASTRHDGWTPKRQRAFIAALTEHGGVAAAVRGVGMTSQTTMRQDTPLV